jgi:hypothetical protein
MTSSSLSRAEAERVVEWLGLPPASLTRTWLDDLLRAYAAHVPWESASRIVRRASFGDAAACVAAPAAFWRDAIEHGTGGTCFESNAALAALLEAHSIPVHRTINDRPPVVGSHTALLVEVDGDRLVVDAGFPLYATVPLPRGGETCTVQTRWGAFSARATPDTADRFRITQHPHPRPLAFELVARPVTPAAYAAATCADYGRRGLFLDRVIVRKLVDGEMWRFASSEWPWGLERFVDGVRDMRPLPSEAAAAADVIGTHFAIAPSAVRRALELIPVPGPGPESR